MESGSLRLGLMAVVAVSGSVVFIANELHKRNGKCQAKKKVRFADNVREPSSNNKEYRKRNHSIAIVKQAKGRETFL
ncbi:rho GTPase-activating protein gacG-like [Gossypium australe]|uniref:Rho GTPase-activating protein gacG-like n=1 Tax=Gossypium australe TaxID=47621 RepID=A0A5B6VRM0_9ROSI|nr:rho GTPase-activating protein gacG-like [Gossypium australe]